MSASGSPRVVSAADPPPSDGAASRPERSWLRRALGRIRVRLLVVNLVVVLVPVAGLEFADLYERQLLDALERDMRNQASLVRRFLEMELRRGVPLGEEAHEAALRDAAARTRTRIRVLDRAREVVVDSHRDGPPEGPEAPPPSLLGSARSTGRWASAPEDRPWPTVPDRQEVRRAFAGQYASYTRVRQRQPAVFLFVAEPVLHPRRVVGVVYVVRSTTPVLEELYRFRRGLVWVTAAAIFFTLVITLLLALSISRPLSKLSKAAGRVAAGERDVAVPVGGSGEIRELGESFAAMHAELGRRLRYIGEFAADVAHEFKSPLTSIRGAAELLEEGAADDPAARQRFLENILLDVERLDRHVSRLLELSRIEAAADTARGGVALEALVRHVVERASTEAHPVELEWATRVALMQGREMDLETALKNLLDNAARHSPPGEPIGVRVEDAPRGAVRVVVEDAGPGVPPAERDKIFARFYTTDREGEGTGLGLAIVRAVAEAHGGRVEVGESARGGARFVMTLPIARGPR